MRGKCAHIAGKSAETAAISAVISAKKSRPRFPEISPEIAENCARALLQLQAVLAYNPRQLPKQVLRLCRQPLFFVVSFVRVL